jgi:2-polyprenyl-6-hydroxyphenyl methylase/3-demethylubiquinone-9 3-methyltransferase
MFITPEIEFGKFRASLKFRKHGSCRRKRGNQHKIRMVKTVDKDEVERFGAIAEEWWDPTGKFRPLHQINPVRLLYIREQLRDHIGDDRKAAKPFAGLQILDVGCGGGLIAEPLARLGASVTGLDASEETIVVARRHAQTQGLDIEYKVGTAERLAAEDRGFDCVLALEIVEHVPDVAAFIRSCSRLMKPDALLLVSTLNRTAKSFALGIVAAEYLLGWLPRGTHQWRRFVTPEELRGHLVGAGLDPKGERGLVFDLLKGEWTLSEDCAVNYFAASVKKAGWRAEK